MNNQTHRKTSACMLQGENKAGEGCGKPPLKANPPLKGGLKGEVSGALVRGGLSEVEGREEEPRELREKSVPG